MHATHFKTFFCSKQRSQLDCLWTHGTVRVACGPNIKGMMCAKLKPAITGSLMSILLSEYGVVQHVRTYNRGTITSNNSFC